ncbi:MAG: hypothetical protein DRN01_06260, partial [Thermoplasmata archaeon]
MEKNKPFTSSVKKHQKAVHPAMNYQRVIRLGLTKERVCP